MSRNNTLLVHILRQFGFPLSIFSKAAENNIHAARGVLAAHSSEDSQILQAMCKNIIEIPTTGAIQTSVKEKQQNKEVK